MNYVARTLASIAAVLAVGLTQAAAVDISGEYVEYGMTIRADPGAPQKEVSFGSLLALELDPTSHQKWFEGDRRVRIKQYEDIAVDFYGFGGTNLQGSRAGSFKGNWTKADGLRVAENELILPRRAPPPPRDLWKAVFVFSLDEEKRLIVSVEFTTTKKPVRVVRGVYAFPRAAE